MFGVIGEPLDGAGLLAVDGVLPLARRRDVVRLVDDEQVVAVPVRARLPLPGSGGLLDVIA